ncbi:hypothetical protein ACFL59_15550, partial [Planctomycetota bacterium]
PSGEEDVAGESEAAKELGERRARSVMDALLERSSELKAWERRFVVQGLGWTAPLATHALSRRVEVTVISPEGSE